MGIRNDTGNVIFIRRNIALVGAVRNHVVGFAFAQIPERINTGGNAAYVVISRGHGAVVLAVLNGGVCAFYRTADTAGLTRALDVRIVFAAGDQHFVCSTTQNTACLALGVGAGGAGVNLTGHLIGAVFNRALRIGTADHTACMPLNRRDYPGVGATVQAHTGNTQRVGGITDDTARAVLPGDCCLVAAVVEQHNALRAFRRGGNTGGKASAGGHNAFVGAVDKHRFAGIIRGSKRRDTGGNAVAGNRALVGAALKDGVAVGAPRDTRGAVLPLRRFLGGGHVCLVENVEEVAVKRRAACHRANVAVVHGCNIPLYHQVFDGGALRLFEQRHRDGHGVAVAVKYAGKPRVCFADRNVRRKIILALRIHVVEILGALDGSADGRIPLARVANRYRVVKCRVAGIDLDFACAVRRADGLLRGGNTRYRYRNRARRNCGNDHQDRENETQPDSKSVFPVHICLLEKFF